MTNNERLKIAIVTGLLMIAFYLLGIEVGSLYERTRQAALTMRRLLADIDHDLGYQKEPSRPSAQETWHSQRRKDSLGEDQESGKE